jgi:hypothetical protein
MLPTKDEILVASANLIAINPKTNHWQQFSRLLPTVLLAVISPWLRVGNQWA